MHVEHRAQPAWGSAREGHARPQLRAQGADLSRLERSGWRVRKTSALGAPPAGCWKVLRQSGLHGDSTP